MKLKGNKCVFHCMSKPNIYKGCLWPPAEGKSEILQMEKKELSITKLSFWQKSNALGILQQNGLNLADLQICIFLLGTIKQT